MAEKIVPDADNKKPRFFYPDGTEDRAGETRFLPS
jgi:hypothetical protein